MHVILDVALIISGATNIFQYFINKELDDDITKTKIRIRQLERQRDARRYPNEF